MVASFREILLGDETGKCVENDVRDSFWQYVKSFAVNSQYGSGFNGGETASAHLYVRLIMDLCISSH